MSGFKRGMDRSRRRQELKIQGAFNPERLRIIELTLEGALIARRTARGPDDDAVESMMLDWSIIREELPKGKARWLT